MLEKNKQKERNKRMRNTWAFNPTTKIKESRKRYNRKSRKNKREESKRTREDSSFSFA